MRNYQIRAIYDEKTVRVYQAFSPAIAGPAVGAQTFVLPFSMSRMTWIKPSFCWMMYRCGYARKPGQEAVLAIDITRQGFDWALEQAVLSSFHPSVHDSHEYWKNALADAPVRVQWDPERNLKLEKVSDVRAIQIGLSGEAVIRYVRDWIVSIEDITPVAQRLCRRNGTEDLSGLPNELEKVYPVSEAMKARIIPE